MRWRRGKWCCFAGPVWVQTGPNGAKWTQMELFRPKWAQMDPNRPVRHQRQLAQFYAAHRATIVLIAVVLRVDGSGIKVQVVSALVSIPGRGPPVAVAARSTLVAQRPIRVVGIAGSESLRQGVAWRAARSCRFAPVRASAASALPRRRGIELVCSGATVIDHRKRSH